VIAGLSVAGFIAIAIAVMLAAALQASIGFGMGMLAAPVVALVDPGLIPGTLIILAVVVTLMVVLTERQHIDLGGTGWALAGRVPGTIAGALLVAAMPERWLVLMLAGVVLLGVVLTSAGWRPAPDRPNLVMAGATSGLLGTATSIGGPPMALVWQGKQGPGYRGTISGFFLVGSAFSVLALAVTGSIDHAILVAVVLLIPAPVVGFGLSRLINRYLSPVRLRWTAIGVSCFGALLLIGQQVL
jgi:uncharacterized membrane protein YfcA